MTEKSEEALPPEATEGEESPSEQVVLNHPVRSILVDAVEGISVSSGGVRVVTSTSVYDPTMQDFQRHITDQLHMPLDLARRLGEALIDVVERAQAEEDAHAETDDGRSSDE